MDNYCPKISIVEDEKGLRLSTEKLLIRKWQSLTTAKNSNSGNNKDQVIDFDLILIDLKMSVIDRFKVLREIEKNKTSTVCFIDIAYASYKTVIAATRLEAIKHTFDKMRISHKFKNLFFYPFTKKSYKTEIEISHPCVSKAILDVIIGYLGVLIDDSFKLLFQKRTEDLSYSEDRLREKDNNRLYQQFFGENKYSQILQVVEF